MPTLIAFHEVGDIDHWLSSPKRAEIFGPMGITVRTFRDVQSSNRTAVLLDVSDLAAFEDAMESEAAAEAMKFDGVRRETLVVLPEA